MFSSNRDYRTYLSPPQLKGTVELVEVSQLSSYQPSKPFLLFGHGSKPLSKYTRVHRLWDTRDEGLFWKFWITRTDFKRLKWSKRIAINRSYLSLEKPKGPEIQIHDKRTLKIKLCWSLTDIGIGVCVKTQNRSVERRWLSVLGRTLPPGEKNKKGEGYSYTLAKGRLKRAILIQRWAMRASKER